MKTIDLGSRTITLDEAKVPPYEVSRLENEIGRLKREVADGRKAFVGLLIFAALALWMQISARNSHIREIEEKYRVQWEDTWAAKQGD